MSDCKINSFVPRDGMEKKNYRPNNVALHSALVLFDLETKREIVEIRTYYPGSVAYACVWIRKGDERATGSGKAGGHGYDKTEAAVKAAFGEAGVNIEQASNHHDPRTLLEGLAAFWGMTNYHIFHAHA